MQLFNKYIVLAISLAPFSFIEAKSDFTLANSEVTYTVEHSFKTTVGTSKAAKGKGVCEANGSCEFLVAVPVKTFESGNANRDTHMLQTVKGALFPMVSVHFWAALKDKQLKITKIECDLAGIKKEITPVNENFELGTNALKGKIELPILLSHFNIERPSLLGFAIDDKVIIRATSEWNLKESPLAVKK